MYVSMYFKIMSKVVKYTCGLCQGRPQDLRGGGQELFFFRFGNLHVAKRHAAHSQAMRIARGFGGMLPEKFF